MPYASNADLPERLRRVLPEHAQDIYRAAFNNAWLARRGEGDEATLHRIAWGAVKRRYRKSGDRWVPRD
ncbi:cation transport regulator [Caldovatus sediminis]|jgi:cation transport regulator|uniref:Cation transport regulator n=1 Tax=Caldovatus sediminis TaxID=2041189 RepID=A0A8J2ZEJ6_9PROT|nr:ChaB family protein [Caldovatus sediminis]GGG45455.1 cation transport regulator [Caldovatus sediminis]